MQFNVFKMAAKGGHHFEINIKTEYHHAHLTNVILVYYAINHFMGLFYEYCSFNRHYWKKINIHCELVMSQPH